MKRARRYYVYALVDPRDGRPFYYGKGTGKRAKQHLADYKASRVVNAAKHLRIGEIIAAGFAVDIKIIKDKLTEQAAFALETKLIREERERRAITNGGAGSQYSLSRLTADRTAINDLITRTRPLKKWLLVVQITERRKATREDIEYWFDTVDWLSSVRQEIDDKIGSIQQVLSHHMQR